MVFYDSALTAGVDYEEYINDDDPYNDPDYEITSEEERAEREATQIEKSEIGK